MKIYDKWLTKSVPNVLVILLMKAAVVQAGSIPFQETWEYDGPQPHGPGNGLLFDHQPHNFGGLAADTSFSELPGGTPFPWQILADDFVVATGTPIRRVVFWGLYNFGVEPTASEVFEIKFYDARPGDELPGNVLYQTSVVNPLREWTGRHVIVSGAPREHRYTLDLLLPFTPTPSDKYWLSIYQVGDPDAAFRWEFCATAEFNGQAIINPNYPDWFDTTTENFFGDNAFQLYSTPEPTTGVFCLLGTLGLGCWRCGRKH